MSPLCVIGVTVFSRWHVDCTAERISMPQIARVRHSVVNVTKSNTGMWCLYYLQKSCTRANVKFSTEKNAANDECTKSIPSGLTKDTPWSQVALQKSITSCISHESVVHFARKHFIFYCHLILCVWHRLHVHCWLLHGSGVPHKNRISIGISILITSWSVCTGISYWREPFSCNLHEGTRVRYNTWQYATKGIT